MATGTTPAMVSKTVGKGSAYITAALDSEGHYLDGSKTYTVTLPADAFVFGFECSNHWGQS